MPLFHSNAVIAGWAPTLAVGATVALKRRFSASQFIPDCRAVGATYANYVGTPLSYVLAQPPQPDDRDNALTRVFGNEGAPADLERFGERFGCEVIDGFGSTEGGISISRTARHTPLVRSVSRWGMCGCSTLPPARSGRSRSSTSRAGCSTVTRPSASWSTSTGRSGSRATGTPRRTPPTAPATAATGPATWATATPTASSTSPAAPSTGSASEARTSPPHRSPGC